MDFHWLVMSESLGLWSKWHFVDIFDPFRGYFWSIQKSSWFCTINGRQASAFSRVIVNLVVEPDPSSVFLNRIDEILITVARQIPKKKSQEKMGPESDKTGPIKRVKSIENYVILTIQYAPDVSLDLFCVPSCKDCKQLMVSMFQSRSWSWLSRDSTVFGCSNLLFLILLFFLRSNLILELKSGKFLWYLTYVSNDRPSWWHCMHSYDFHPIIPTNVYGFFSQ